MFLVHVVSQIVNRFEVRSQNPSHLLVFFEGSGGDVFTVLLSDKSLRGRQGRISDDIDS